MSSLGECPSWVFPELVRSFLFLVFSVSGRLLQIEPSSNPNSLLVVTWAACYPTRGLSVMLPLVTFSQQTWFVLSTTKSGFCGRSVWHVKDARTNPNSNTHTNTNLISGVNTHTNSHTDPNTNKHTHTYAHTNTHAQTHTKTNAQADAVRHKWKRKHELSLCNGNRLPGIARQPQWVRQQLGSSNQPRHTQGREKRIPSTYDVGKSILKYWMQASQLSLCIARTEKLVLSSMSALGTLSTDIVVLRWQLTLGSGSQDSHGPCTGRVTVAQMCSNK